MPNLPIHPLTVLLERIRREAPTIRDKSAYWATGKLVPVLREIRAAIDDPKLTGKHLADFVSTLRTLLSERHETRPILALKLPNDPTLRAADDGERTPDHVALDGRIPNEIRPVVEKIIEVLAPEKPGSPSHPPTEQS